MEHNTTLEDLAQVLIDQEPDGLAQALAKAYNAAMLIERAQALGAEPYQRTGERTGYANGFKSKKLLSRVGELELAVPQVRGTQFYPSVIEKGQRIEKALMLAMAEMYLQGVSTRKVRYVMEELCGGTVSSAQVSKATAELDAVIEPWRTRSLADESYCYLYLDATYVKVRRDGLVQNAAVLIAVAVNTEGKRRIVGLSVEISEAEIHWRTFLKSLIERGFSGVKLIISDAHTGLKEARNSVFPSVPWQRCQFHMQQNARAFARKIEEKAEIAGSLRRIFDSLTLEDAQVTLAKEVAHWRDKHSRFALWLEENMVESLTIFKFPEIHRRRLRTTNMLERLNKEIKRRTRVASLFPNEESLQRLVGALLMEQDEEWLEGRVYLSMDAQ